MRRARPLRLLMLALLLGGCASGTLRDTGPKLRELAQKRAPEPEELPIVLSDPVEPNAELALQNYREILKLAPDEATRAEAMRRIADLQIEIQSERGGAAGNDSYLSAIRLYERLLAENPDDPKNYRVLYQLARAYQNSGQEAKAAEVLARLAREFPDLDISHEGRFRRADLLFRLRRYAEAAEEYAFIVGLGRATPFFEQAQHMLAWSYYKQGEFAKVLDVEFRLLDSELPPGELLDPVAALAQVRPAQRELIQDALRLTALALINMGAGEAINDAIAARGEPRFFPLVYEALGQALLERQRYSDAARTYAAFRERYAAHPLAPHFQTRVITALEAGGFTERVMEEKARYARLYDPQAEYWAGRRPSAEVDATLRAYMEDLARYWHALGPERGAEAYLEAAGWYARLITLWSEDPAVPELSFLLGDALLDGGQTLQAAQAYERTAWELPRHERSAEAAYAAVLAWYRHAGEVPPEQRPDAVRKAVETSVRLADSFPDHPQAMAVLTRAAEELFAIGDPEEAILLARRVTQAVPPADPPLQRTAWGVMADAQYVLGRWALAENAYTQLLLRTPDDLAERARIGERIAETIYRQAEQARDAGDLAAAVEEFLRLGKVVPQASIRPNAEYDAAVLLMRLEDWDGAAEVLERFRRLYPEHRLIPDVDKQLALAHDRAGRALPAAEVYARIARRATEAEDVRKAAAWRSAELFDEAGDAVRAAQAWAFWAESWRSPLEDALHAHERLVALATARGDELARRRRLRGIVELDATAGAERSSRSRILAARAALELGRADARNAAAVTLRMPLAQSLKARKEAVEAALGWLRRAIEYRIAEVTTAATYELGELYRRLAADLLASERPPGLDPLALEQYELLLEEQAFPFEEQAIGFYETNLRRIPSGIYDEWVARSYEALAQMVPARYGRQPKLERFHESLD